MSALTRSIRGSKNQLLYHVLEEPQLLAAVRELPAPVLVRLIHHVGLEDAGELIALTSTQQLGQVFDAELWQAAEPGSDETFRPERFALFLHLLYEAGESFVVERLLALPRQLLTLAFHKLLLVVDIDALTVRFQSAGRFADDSIDRAVRVIEDAHFEEWEEFRLIARDPNAFEDVWNALLALDREDHELVRYVIERCCDMDGELIEESGLYAVLNDEEMLESDMISERSERRAAAGFVAPADARAFLELARRELIVEAPDGRDAISRAYFRELSPDEPTTSHAARVLPGNARAGAQVQPDVGRLLAVLRDANVLDDESAASAAIRQLTSPGERAAAKLERGSEVAPSGGGAAGRSKAKPKAKRSAAAPSKRASKAEQAAVSGSRGRPDSTGTRGAEAGLPAAKRASKAAPTASAVSGSRGRPDSTGTRGAELALPGRITQPADDTSAKYLTLMASSLLVLRAQNAVLHAQRTEELGFLANVLLAGSQHNGRKFRPVEAIECALAVCSVGLECEHVLRAADPGAQPTAAQAALLLLELSADRLFRAGLYALRTQVGERARTLVAHLLGVKLVDAPAAVSGGTETLVPQLNIAGEGALALAALADPEPWLAGSLAASDHVFIASKQDVQHALDFLAACERDATAED